jgi:hypothetical protein
VNLAGMVVLHAHDGINGNAGHGESTAPVLHANKERGRYK